MGKRLRGGAWVCAVALLALMLSTLAAAAAAPTPTKGQLTGPYTYSNASGARDYFIYLPANYDARVARPLLIELHGCSPDKAETEARWSRMNIIAAEQYGFLVVYPQQAAGANGSGCWNWFEPADQTRKPGAELSPASCNCSSTGEPSLIAGITKRVMADFNADPGRVYVGGISAGGAMSNIMAVTYPDLYAAAMVYAGCDYRGLPCLGSVSAVPGNVAGQFAYDEMVANRGDGVVPRVVPVIIIQGDADAVVPFPNSKEVLHQFLTTDALATGGAASAVPPSATRSRVVTATPPAQSYIVDDYQDSAGCTLAEHWLVNGMGHQWSHVTPPAGSVSDTIFNDPDGPDVTTPIVQFFLAHPMPPAGQGSGCYEVAPPAGVPETPWPAAALLLGVTAAVAASRGAVRSRA